ncbi:MAG: PepSY-like domain-containing protein [Bacteroidetes bacterium]|nr:PepSY-like domain-containing protein [Bacteroidota bacterium]HET6243120.1 PepSY-like domain-containing protein [Bacteroidia bacterium]
MKKIHLLVVILFISCSVYAQKKDVQESAVPKLIKDNFSTKYPDAKNRSWKTKNGDYEVDFNFESKKLEAKYTTDGTWKKTSMNINKKELPSTILESHNKSEFRSWMIDDIKQIETPDYKILYFIRVVKARNITELLYNPLGELMKVTDKN